MSYPTSYTSLNSVPHEKVNPIHDTVHVAEMHRVAAEEIERLVPKMIEEECTRIFNRAIDSIMGAITYDINTSLTIAFDDLDYMFKSSKARKIVSDRILKTIKRQLFDVKLNFKLWL